MDDLALDRFDHANAMAVALAAMHWGAMVDAADVEFVLGTALGDIRLTSAELEAAAPRTGTRKMLNFKKRTVYLWLLDFNQCTKITMDDIGVAKAVDAFWQNDPYFPRPLASGQVFIINSMSPGACFPKLRGLGDRGVYSKRCGIKRR